MFIKKIVTAFFISLIFFGIATNMKAHENFEERRVAKTLEGTITKIVEETEVGDGDQKHVYQELERFF